MSDLLAAGAVSKIKDGVKLLGGGREKFEALNIPLQIEISDASSEAIEAVSNKGGKIQVQYRTDLLMKQHLKPWKFADNKELKAPMPPAKKIKKLERLERKGLEVSFPNAPWFHDNLETIKADREEKKRRIREGAGSELLPNYPAHRYKGVNADKPRQDKEDLPWKFKFPTQN